MSPLRRAFAHSAPAAPGSLFADRYRLEELLGRGGMGAVWRATDEALEREVAVKILHPDVLRHREGRERFKREMKRLAQLEDENIVRLYASGVDPQPFMVMQLLRAITLRERLAAVGRLDWKTAICFAVQIAAGLGTAHKVPIYHRDIKPENLLVHEDGNLWIVDFGIAQDGGAPRSPSITDRMASLGYMTPEMVLHKPIDHRSDFYQLGVVLQEMLTGQRPYSEADEASEKEMQAAHAVMDPDPIPLLAPECPAALCAIVDRLLAKDPADRYGDAGAVIAALMACMPAPAPADKEHPLTRNLQRQFVRNVLHSRPPTGDERTDPEEPRPSGPREIEPHDAPAVAPRETCELGPGFVAPSPYASKPPRPAPSGEPAVAPRETCELGPAFVPASPCATQPRKKRAHVAASVTIPLGRASSGEVYWVAEGALAPAAPAAQRLTVELPAGQQPPPMRMPFRPQPGRTAALPRPDLAPPMRAPFPLAPPNAPAVVTSVRRRAGLALKVARVAGMALGVFALLVAVMFLCAWLLIRVLPATGAPGPGATAAPQHEKVVSP